MPSILSTERITSVSWIDTEAVKTWRVKVAGEAKNALSLAQVEPYIVFVVRNTKSLLGVVACYEIDNSIKIVHLATRDTGKDITKMLIDKITDFADGKRIKAWKDYAGLGWRKVGMEYWSK